MQPPARVTVIKNVGLHVTCSTSTRGHVTFSPDQVMAWKTRGLAQPPWAPVWAPPELAADGKHWVTVTFHEPGTYVIRSHADDGALMADGQVTVVVTP